MLTEATFTKAYRTYGDALVGRATAMTGNHADAEEIAQDAWVAAWRERGKIELPTIFAWLCRVVKRAWWWRMNPRRRKAPEFAPIEDAPEQIMDAPQEHITQRAQILDAARTLSEARARAVRYALADHEPAEVARVERISVSGASEALRKAVADLRRKWRIG